MWGAARGPVWPWAGRVLGGASPLSPPGLPAEAAASGRMGAYVSRPPLTQEPHVVQFQSQEVGTHILAEWIIADCMAAVYGFQSKIKEEQKESKLVLKLKQH